jgi:hypothetical protein
MSKIASVVSRRVAIVLAMAVPTATWIISAGMAPAASAAESCDTSGGNCYAIAGGTPGGGNYGEVGSVHVNCLYVPDNGTFVNAEMWDASKDAAYWTEVGVSSGPIAGTYYDKQWFWADNRPNGGGYHEHAAGQTAALNQAYTMELAWLGNNEWGVWGGNSFNRLGTSTGQPVTSSGLMEAGTEYTAPSGSGMRNVGGINSLEYRNTSNNTWYGAGSGLRPIEAGPGAYITPGYGASSSDVGWTGPC